jgi:hypothetical protein
MIITNSQNISAIGPFQKDVPYLQSPNEYSFESFMRVYLNKDNQFFYNLLTTQISFDGELDPSTYYVITINRRVPWTTISYDEYRDISLWWLILAVNKIRNPVEFPVPGTELKMLYPEYVRKVIDRINEKLAK